MLTAPSRFSRVIRNSTARAKSSSWIHETHCRPLPCFPPSPTRDEVRQHRESISRHGAECDRRSHCHLARARRVGFEERCLPVASPRESRSSRYPALPALRRRVRRSSHPWGGQVHDGRSSRLTRSATRGADSERPDHFAQKPGRHDARVVDFDAIIGSVAAVHAAAGQVDADVRAFEILRPEARASVRPSALSATRPYGARA